MLARVNAASRTPRRIILYIPFQRRSAINARPPAPALRRLHTPQFVYEAYDQSKSRRLSPCNARFASRACSEKVDRLFRSERAPTP